MNPSRIWLDAHTLYRSFRCIRIGQPIRWREVPEACRSRWFRRGWIKTCRKNSMFKAGWDWCGKARYWRATP